jgi:cerevisin
MHTLAKSEDPAVEKGAPWGLARISHRDSLTFGTFNKYLYSSDGGEGVDVYVIDTGTNVDHVDFEGRATWGKTIPQGDEDKDGNGHGTHCSGTVAGKKYGVAKKAHVKAVKVLRSNGSGSMSDVVKGVEFAAESHIEQVDKAKKGKRKGFKGSAANMSLGGGKSALLDQAVNAAVDAGIHFAVAAGNDNADSCRYSPAAAEKAVTVGASTLADERAYFSNFGKCNDIFAPGLNILSTWIGSETATNVISGTSMASPHIAGLLAYLLSLQPSKSSAYAVAEITPKKLKADLLSIATVGALEDVPSDTANVSYSIFLHLSFLLTQPRSLPGTVVALPTTPRSSPPVATKSRTRSASTVLRSSRLSPRPTLPTRHTRRSRRWMLRSSVRI